MRRITTAAFLVLALAPLGGCQSDGGDPEGTPRFSTELGAETIHGNLEMDESVQEGGGILD